MQGRRRTSKGIVVLTAAVLVMAAAAPSLADSTATMPEFDWVVKVGDGDDERGYSVAIDAEGTVVVVGGFEGTVDFDPGAGTTSLASAGDTDIFVMKLSMDGDLLWAVRAGSTGADQAFDVAIDSVGNIVVVGSFEGTVDFDPGGSTNSKTSAGDDDAFVWILDLDGQLVRVQTFGGTNSDVAQGVAVDLDDRVYITGGFMKTVDFDPEGGVFDLTASGSLNRYDVFVVRLSASGSLSWAERAGADEHDRGYRVALGPDGTVVVTGGFSETVDFDPGGGTDLETSAGGTDVFVWKLGSGGAHKWVRRVGGISYENGHGVDVDSDGEIVVTGDWETKVDFDPGPGVFNMTPKDRMDMFVWKLTDGGDFVWARKFGGNHFDAGYDVAIDENSAIFAIGWFQHSSGPSERDALLVRLDETGNEVFQHRVGGSKDDIGFGVAIGSDGLVAVTGLFTGTVDFDPGDGITTRKSDTGSEDIFVFQWLAPTPECFGRPATIIGSDDADVLDGTSTGDVIVGLGGNDEISGGKGNDRICGGDGGDDILGGSGKDRIDGGSGGDTIDGGAKKDKLFGGGGKDDLSGGSGNDVLKGGGKDDTLKGGGGDDKLVGGGGTDTADGEGGIDTCDAETEVSCEL